MEAFKARTGVGESINDDAPNVNNLFDDTFFTATPVRGFSNCERISCVCKLILLPIKANALDLNIYQLHTHACRPPPRHCFLPPRPKKACELPVLNTELHEASIHLIHNKQNNRQIGHETDAKRTSTCFFFFFWGEMSQWVICYNVSDTRSHSAFISSQITCFAWVPKQR